MMKNFYSFATLAVAAVASEDLGPWRWSETAFVTLIDISNTAGDFKFKWTMSYKTGYEEDSGLEYFRIEHELESDVKATDEVTFEIAFRMQNDPWTNKMLMSDDGVICKVV